MYCCQPPTIPTTIDVNDPERCYLYRAIFQGKTDLAIQWLDQWATSSLNADDKTSVLWECVKRENEALISYLLGRHLVTQQELDKLRTDWQRICV